MGSEQRKTECAKKIFVDEKVISPNSLVVDDIFDSGMMMVDQSWESTFTDSGEYDYYCMLHPWMTGKVIVS